MFKLRIWLGGFVSLILFAIFPSSAKAQNVLDVLILYTERVEEDHFGEDGVIAHVQASFASANEAFRNSEVNIRLRLREISKIDYIEDDDDMGVDLDYITNSAEIAILRDEVGADLVCLHRHSQTDEASGIAWLLSEEEGQSSRGFSVVATHAAISILTFQHEVGHNLGSAHSREDDDSIGLFPYSHAYRRTGPTGRDFNTIMVSSSDNLINYFSNPNVEYEGIPTGLASGSQSADNARGFNFIADAVDSYREYVHRMPVALAGEDKVKEDSDGDGFAEATLNGSLSEALTAIVDWEWSWLDQTRTGSEISVEFPVGLTVVTLTVTDDEGFTDQDTVLITVLDNSRISIVEAGADHSWFLKDSGLLFGAGENEFGQLGDGSNQDRLTPVQLNIGDVRAVSGGTKHSLLVKEDGSAWAVGDNEYGQLGDGTTENRDIPVQVFASGVSQVAAGQKHSLFLMSDGSLWSCGISVFGFLENDDGDFHATPVKVIDGGVQSIWAGDGHSLFIKNDGSLWGGGVSTHGQLGPGTVKTLVQILPSGVSAISGGTSHTVILKSDGSLWTMGRNEYGQLGDGSTTDRSSPTLVVDSEVVYVAAARDYSLFIKSDGSLWIMGRNWYDLNGDSELSMALEPTLLIGSEAVAVSAGWEHVLLQREDGSVWTIGDNRSGQLGIGSYSEPPHFSRVFHADIARINSAPVANAGVDIVQADGDGDGFDIVELDASMSFDDWQISSWKWHFEGKTSIGKSFRGPLKEGVTELTLEVQDDDGGVSFDTVIVTVNPQTRIDQIAAGSRHTLILKSDGSLWGAGDNDHGELGNGTKRSSREFELLEVSGVMAIEAGGGHSLFIRKDGSLWGMGNNRAGELGSDFQDEVLVPVLIVDDNVVSVASSGSTLFIKEDGSLWGMGLNGRGQLGDGTTENRSSPVEVIEAGVVKIATRDDHSMFVMDDGSLWGMGANELGQLGDGTMDDRSTPVEIFSSGVSDISLGSGYSLIVMDDGSLWACGWVPLFGSGGASEPFELISEGVKSVAAGQSHYFILMTDGSVLGGGDNRHGVFGDGTFENRPIPTQVIPLEVALVAAGDDHSLFVLDDGSLWGSGQNSGGQLGLGSEFQVNVLTETISKPSFNLLLDWLSSFYSQNEIDEIASAPDLADLDFDGYSNERERILGLDPSVPFDPFTQSDTRIFFEDDELKLGIGTYAPGLYYKLSGSTDLVDWSELSHPTFERDGMLIFELPKDGMQLYRVEISEVD